MDRKKNLKNLSLFLELKNNCRVKNVKRINDNNIRNPKLLGYVKNFGLVIISQIILIKSKISINEIFRVNFFVLNS